MEDGVVIECQKAPGRSTRGLRCGPRSPHSPLRSLRQPPSSSDRPLSVHPDRPRTSPTDCGAHFVALLAPRARFSRTPPHQNEPIVLLRNGVIVLLCRIFNRAVLPAIEFCLPSSFHKYHLLFYVNHHEYPTSSVGRPGVCRSSTKMIRESPAPFLDSSLWKVIPSTRRRSTARSGSGTR
jgi:hypothetical protein